MSLSSIKRRVVALEARVDRGFATGPLASAEIEDILQRVQNGQSLCTEELPRIEGHGYVVGRNMIISVHRGSVKVKRYLGVNMDAV